MKLSTTQKVGIGVGVATLLYVGYRVLEAKKVENNTPESTQPTTNPQTEKKAGSVVPKPQTNEFKPSVSQPVKQPITTVPVEPVMNPIPSYSPVNQEPIVTREPIMKMDYRRRPFLFRNQIDRRHLI